MLSLSGIYRCAYIHIGVRMSIYCAYLYVYKLQYASVDNVLSLLLLLLVFLIVNILFSRICLILQR